MNQYKIKLTLTVNKSVFERAKELIPNLSAFVEMKLREYIILFEAGLKSIFGADPPGFEPGIYGLEGRRSIQAEPRAHYVNIFWL